MMTELTPLDDSLSPPMQKSVVGGDGSASKKEVKGALMTRLWNSIVYCCQNITIEPLMFCHAAAFNLTLLINTSLAMDKICQVGTTWFSNGSHFSVEVCDALDSGHYEEQQNFVQSAFAKVSMASSYFGQLAPIVMALVMGSLADTKGRRLVLYLTMLNQVIDNHFYLTHSVFFHEISANYFVFEDVGNIFGSTTAFFMAVYAYSADISSDHFRMGRLAITDISYSVSQAFFGGIAGYLFKHIGYNGIYVFAICWSLLGMLYIFLFLKESLKFEEENTPSADPATSADQTPAPAPSADPAWAPSAAPNGLLPSLLEPFSATWKVLSQKRPHGLRHIIWLLLLLHIIRTFSDGSAKSQLEIAYQKKILPWESVQEFNIFHSKVTAAGELCRVLVLIVTPFIIQIDFFKDIMLNIINMFCALLSKLIYIVAWSPAAIYLAEIASSPTCLKNISFRSQLTRLVPSSDTGKILGLISFNQSLIRFTSGFWFVLYNATLDSHPGYIFCVGATVALVTLAGLFYVLFYTNKVEKQVMKKNDPHLHC